MRRALLRAGLLLTAPLLGLLSLTLGFLASRRLAAGEAVWPLVLAFVALNAFPLFWLGRRPPGPEALSPDAGPPPGGAPERPWPALEAGQVGTRDWDLATGHMTWSPNVPALLGAAEGLAPSLEGLLACVVPEDRDAVRDALERPAGDGYCVELRVPDGQGGVRWLEDKGRVIRDPAGRAVRMTGAIRDVTDRREATEQLRAARDANEAKSAFLASMSHEMRTPLGGIIGMTELLLQTPVTDQQRDFLKTLSRSAEALFALINDVLDVSKIEAGKMELERIDFDVRELVHDALRVVALQAQRKGLTLSAEVEPAVPRAVVGDPGRLRQVLLNLLSNAVKFTPRGEVAVAVRVGAEADLLQEGGSNSRGSDQGKRLRAEVARDQRALVVCFEVRDTGVGIPAEKQARIFEPFAQADSSTTRVHGGTGLGLTIALRLVERMGGRLTVRSAPGEGSTFAFALPYLAADAPAPRSRALTPTPPTAGRGPAAPGLRVLVAEDNPVNQEVFTLLLGKAGCQVELAGTGAEAVAAVERGRFDLVLMDLQMPEMDGLRATRLIRAREKASGGRVPIVAVTANALQGEKERCLGAGMDGYLTKPVRGPELLGLIDELLGPGASPGAAAPAGRPAGPGWLAALAASGLDADEAGKLARTFLDTAPARLARLRQAVADHDPDAVHRAAHLLKGSLAVFSARQALDAAASLERMGRADVLAAAPAALATLQAEVRALQESLKNFLHGPPADRIEN